MQGGSRGRTERGKLQLLGRMGQREREVLGGVRGALGTVEKWGSWRLRHEGTPEAGLMVHSSNQLGQLGRKLKRDQGQD